MRALTWHGRRDLRVDTVIAEQEDVIVQITSTERTGGQVARRSDLRGYGRSSTPTTTPDHAPYSKRATAGDLVRLMRLLGHERLAVVGHDRGSYVALRLALDHPEAVERLAVLDGIPISEALARCGSVFAQKWWHWFFYAQPDNPERVILADPDAWYGGTPEYMGEEAYAEYRTAIHDPATVRAMPEDYRAGLGIDRAHEQADRAAGRRLATPTTGRVHRSAAGMCRARRPHHHHRRPRHPAGLRAGSFPRPLAG